MGTNNIKIEKEPFIKATTQILSNIMDNDFTYYKSIKKKDLYNTNNTNIGYNEFTTYDIITENEKIMSLTDISKKVRYTDGFTSTNQSKLDKYISFNLAYLVALNISYKFYDIMPIFNDIVQNSKKYFNNCIDENEIKRISNNYLDNSKKLIKL